MNKSSILLLPTVLAVSTSARAQSSSSASRAKSIDAMNRPTAKNRRVTTASAPHKPLSIDLVFSINK